uniref:Uncharacterized protein n=1 Tax=Romanomermis culicivorax TaxID=13658 RepID=A0A915HXI5_ROMCU
MEETFFLLVEYLDQLLNTLKNKHLWPAKFCYIVIKAEPMASSSYDDQQENVSYEDNPATVIMTAPAKFRRSIRSGGGPAAARCLCDLSSFEDIRDRRHINRHPHQATTATFDTKQEFCIESLQEDY